MLLNVDAIVTLIQVYKCFLSTVLGTEKQVSKRDQLPVSRVHLLAVEV